jgi:hypothetical protein
MIDEQDEKPFTETKATGHEIMRRGVLRGWRDKISAVPG